LHPQKYSISYGYAHSIKTEFFARNSSNYNHFFHYIGAGSRRAAGSRGKRCTIINKFGRFFGRISDETCLKMDYFSSKSLKNSQAPPDPLASSGWAIRLQTPVQVK